MPEQVDLPAAIVKTHTRWALARIEIDIERKQVSIRLAGNNGETFSAHYPTPPPPGSSQPSGQALLTALNTANLTSNSLVKRIFTRLVSDGYIAGTVTGTPE